MVGQARMETTNLNLWLGKWALLWRDDSLNTNDIILTIDAEISRLQQAKAILTDTFSLAPAKRKPGRPATASGSGKATSLIRQTLMPRPGSAGE
jgi:hypothetical protein